MPALPRPLRACVLLLAGAAASASAAGCAGDEPAAPAAAAPSAVPVRPAARAAPEERAPPRYPLAVALARAGSHVRSVRETALAEVVAAGAAGRDAARRGLLSEDADVRRGAAGVLARVADATCVKDLADAAVRPGADDDVIVALGRAPVPEAAAALLLLIEGEDELRGIVAARAVASFRGPLDLARLRADTAAGRATPARRSAVAALAGHALAEDHDLFLEASRDPAPSIRAAAARGLFATGRATEDDVRRLVVADPEEPVRVAAASAAAGAPLAIALAPLTEALQAFRDDETVPAAIGALAAHREPAAFDALAEFVADDTQTSDLRGEAVRGLVAIDSVRAVAFLRRESAVFDLDTRAYCDEVLIAQAQH